MRNKRLLNSGMTDNTVSNPKRANVRAIRSNTKPAVSKLTKAKCCLTMFIRAAAISQLPITAKEPPAISLRYNFISDLFLLAAIRASSPLLGLFQPSSKYEIISYIFAGLMSKHLLWNNKHDIIEERLPFILHGPVWLDISSASG